MVLELYNDLSVYGKCVLWLLLFVIIGMLFNNSVVCEGMTSMESFSENSENYDEFYSEIYDSLVLNPLRVKCEVDTIMSIHPKKVLDIGCGTGHVVAELNKQGITSQGIDSSKYMIKVAKQNYPNLSQSFWTGNIEENPHLINYQSYDCITCLYFTFYYIQNKNKLLQQLQNWLTPNGYLIIHLVDKDKFDPILPPGNPLYIVSAQKYAKKRITKTKITFNDFIYTANFYSNPNDSQSTFKETFQFKNGKTKIQEHILYMDSNQDIVQLAKQNGLKLHSIKDMIDCAYEHQYLYIFQKLKHTP